LLCKKNKNVGAAVTQISNTSYQPLRFRMKSVQFYVGIVFVIAVLLTAVLAEDVQHPLIDDATITIEDPAFVDSPIVDDLDKNPIPLPVWSLCGNPSKHLLIPYSLNPAI
jgi:hypothetical protein